MKKAKKTAFSGIMAALSVVILLLGSILDVLDMSVAAIASFVTALVFIELRGNYPWLVYTVTAALSLILLPNKFGVLLYICFFGYYPMLKFLFDSKLKLAPVRMLCKFAVFLIGMASMVLLYVKLFSGVVFADTGKNIVVLTAVLCAATFFVYDLALGKLIIIYELKWRKYIQKYL